MNSRRTLLLLCAVLTPMIIAASLMALTGSPESVKASSHREAPMISKDAFADTTDTYVWIPQGVTDRVAIAAAWIPFEGPEGGPNYFEWDDSALYDIFVDIDGDAKPEVTYTLSSRVALRNGNTFLYNTGPINTLADPDWNRTQYYSVTETFEPGIQPAKNTIAPNAHVTNIVANRLAPPVNIGGKSTPDYDALAEAAVYQYLDDNGDLIKVFAGQRDDPFWVDLQVFDLLTLRGQAAPIGYPSGNNTPLDSLAGYNVHALVIEVPISRLVRNNQPIIGVWAGTRRASTRVLAPLGGSTSSGEYVQVSRLGMPLVNEAVIPYALKDAFNGLKPEQDLATYQALPLLQESIINPELGKLLCGLYGVTLPLDGNADCSSTDGNGRVDIFEIFLKGIKLDAPFTIQTAGGPVTLPAGFNVNEPPAVQASEMIRINTAVSGALCHPTPQRLGVLAGDACGFPNGRRLTDDVVEIELLAVAGAAYEAVSGNDDNFAFNPALIGVLTDGVDTNDKAFMTEFPYMASPHSGQERIHSNPPQGQTAISLSSFTVPGTEFNVQWIQVIAGLAAAGLVALGEVYRRRRAR